MKYFLMTFVIFLSIFGTACSQTSGVYKYSYVENFDTFPNPERGLFYGLEENTAMPTTPIRNSCLAARSRQRTLVARYYYFPQVYNAPIPQSTLDFIQRDMDTVRRYGLKLIIKFGYGISTNFVQARIDTILYHINQLSGILQRNADVIAFIEAGWIGAWGEWHSNSQTGNNVRWYDTTATVMRQLVNGYLAALPVEKKIQIRTPYLIQKIFLRTTAITEQESHSATTFARIGFHNDAFISGSNWDDQGTWMGWNGNVSDSISMKDFIKGQSKYAPSGGESDGTGRVTCGNAIWEGSSQHYSFYNGNFLSTAHALLRQGGCWPEFTRRLGYRLVLDSSSITYDGKLNVKLRLRNVGFAAPTSPRRAYIVLANGTNSESYLIASDLRYWLPESNPIRVDMSFAVSPELPAGDYQAYLYFPDAYSTLAGQPDYSIRLANNGIWAANLGMNVLSDVVTVTPPAPACDTVSVANRWYAIGRSSVNVDSIWNAGRVYGIGQIPDSVLVKIPEFKVAVPKP